MYSVCAWIRSPLLLHSYNYVNTTINELSSVWLGWLMITNETYILVTIQLPSSVEYGKDRRYKELNRWLKWEGLKWCHKIVLQAAGESGLCYLWQKLSWKRWSELLYTDFRMVSGLFLILRILTMATYFNCQSPRDFIRIAVYFI